MSDKEKAREKLKNLVVDFKNNIDYYKKLSEADVEDKLVNELFVNILGWDKKDYEKRAKARRGDKGGSADYAFKIDDRIVFFLEVKKVTIPLDKEALSKRIFPQKESTTRGTKRNKQLKRPQRIALLESISKSTFSQIRDNNKSFGLIKPINMKFLLIRRNEISEAQTTLAEQEYDIMNPDDFAFTPYLQYECEGPCSSKHPHQQQIVSWEAYQFMKLNPNSEEHCMKLKDNYGIEKEDWLHYLLIGNLKHKPRTYVIVKIIRFKIEEEQNTD